VQNFVSAEFIYGRKVQQRFKSRRRSIFIATYF